MVLSKLSKEPLNNEKAIETSEERFTGGVVVGFESKRLEYHSRRVLEEK